jgi:hypothetical protein
MLYHQIPSEKKVKPAEILCRLNAHYGEQTLWRDVQVSRTGTISFMKAAEKSRT